MNSALTYQGITLDGATALALLEWQAELGADVAMRDNPLDRFDLPARVEPPAVAAPAPVAAKPTPDSDQADLLAQAQALAAGAATLDALADAQRSFDGIELKKGARNFVFSDGNPAARVLILGEAPGDAEDRQGRPFVGAAGQLLDQMFAAIGLSRGSPDAENALYIINVLTWRPPGNRDPRPDEIDLSLPFLRRHIELATPDVIVLMGNIPCQAALNKRGILKLRGQWDTAFGVPALPMTHPAYLLRNAAAKADAWADVLSLAARLDLPPV
ncbi:uracil-DNA glycosylase [Paracoccus sp. (in: a-proteobacteria)]|uniref:uracil-DNA glycosylase n=1 Tax=Paracoccus sp. TaxID=267 RepID=UPI0026E05F04|nr:uracil-DNA glycosylase [Paracoccus sp. (in: a-proteobacteria)]MDO5647005.1 uracil-DNA glycosylase [Paracoccus sp. (in: a-proteobacteria)]